MNKLDNAQCRLLMAEFFKQHEVRDNVACVPINVICEILTANTFTSEQMMISTTGGADPTRVRWSKDEDIWLRNNYYVLGT